MKSEYKIFTLGTIAFSMTLSIIFIFWSSLFSNFETILRTNVLNEFWFEFIIFHIFLIVVLYFMAQALKEMEIKK